MLQVEFYTILCGVIPWIEVLDVLQLNRWISPLFRERIWRASVSAAVVLTMYSAHWWLFICLAGDTAPSVVTLLANPTH